MRDQDVRRLTIATAGTGERDLFVSYVSEVPVWKATYRLVLPSSTDARKPLLQGWAIVDNTVGEDWENVAAFARRRRAAVVHPADLAAVLHAAAGRAAAAARAAVAADASSGDRDGRGRRHRGIGDR